MTIDNERIRARLYRLIPTAHRERVMTIDRDRGGGVIARYLRGVATLCVAYGITIGIVLALAFHLPLVPLIALAGAFLYAVPYIGEVTMIAVAAMATWATSDGHLGHTIGAAVTALAINLIFDHFVTPNVLNTILYPPLPER
jgi:predicted PurR-regulated permease PerM